MSQLLLAGLMAIFLFFLTGWMEGKKSDERENFGLPIKCTLFFFGVFFLISFGYRAIKDFQNGSPVNCISPGIYKVGLIYQAGGNVNIGVEKKYNLWPKEEKEGLFLFQFPKNDFEGEIKLGAKRLVAYKLTTGDGTFNRYKLE